MTYFAAVIMFHSIILLLYFVLGHSGPTAVDDATKLHISCLGKFGGPIFPWVALGGYDGKNYLNATAAVITFPVNNVYGNKTGLGPALAWEKELV